MDPPIVVPKLQEKPLRAPLVTHDSENKGWEEIAPRKTKDSIQKMGFQRWDMRNLRFYIAGI